MNELLESLQRIFNALGIGTRPDSMPMEEALRLIEEAIAPVKEKLVDEAVDAAIAAGKLYPKERDWARQMAHEDGLRVFAAFVKLRQPISRIASRLRADGAKAQMSQVEKDIARQVGITEAQFLRYSSDSDAAAGMTQIEREVAGKIGIKPELFLKHNPRANR